MMNHAAGSDVTLGHYVGKGEAQLRSGWRTVADFVEAAAAGADKLVYSGEPGAVAKDEHEGELCAA